RTPRDALLDARGVPRRIRRILRRRTARRQRLPQRGELFLERPQDERPRAPFEQRPERFAGEQPLDRRDGTARVHRDHLRGERAVSGGIVSRCTPARAVSGGIVSGGTTVRVVSGAGGLGTVNSAEPPPPRSPLMLTIPPSSTRNRAAARSGRAG